MVRKLLPVLMVFGVFLGSAGESFALPKCHGSYTGGNNCNAGANNLFLKLQQFATFPFGYL